MRFNTSDSSTDKKIRTVLSIYNKNRHNEHMFKFLSHKTKEMTDTSGITSYWDTSREEDYMLIALRYANGNITMKLTESQLLFYLGFRSRDGIWYWPKNDAKVKAFLLHMVRHKRKQSQTA